MKWRLPGLAAALALLAPAPAYACGHCTEDRVATVYDHGVVTAARNGNRQMAFYAIEGRADRLAEAPRVVASALASVRGVNQRSLRISTQAAALSLSYDQRTSAVQITAALDAALASLGLRAALMQARL